LFNKNEVSHSKGKIGHFSCFKKNVEVPTVCGDPKNLKKRTFKAMLAIPRVSSDTHVLKKDLRSPQQVGTQKNSQNICLT